MNKKIFALLPVMLLALAGCDNNTTDPTTSTGPTTTPTTIPTTTDTSNDEDAKIYGTFSNPLTVSQYLENVEQVLAKESGLFSDKKFYIRGYVKDVATWDDSYGQFNTFYLLNSMSDKYGAKVQRAKDGVGMSAGDMLYKGDTVLVEGYAEYYANGYSIFPGDSDPKVHNRELGTSSFTCTIGENVTMDKPNTSYKNGSVVTLNPKVASGYVVKVTSNGAVVKPENGVYNITVIKDMVVEVTARPDVAASDLPAGTYKSTINKTNCGLTTVANTSIVETELSVKDDTESTAYKGVTYKFGKGCNQHNSYDEFVVGKGSDLTITAPNGKITTIVLEVYKSNYSSVYAGNTASGTAIKGTSVTPETTGYSDTLAYEYTINNQSAYISVPSSASYALTCYKIMVNIVVE